MNHIQAVEMKSPMRYVLGELAEPERDEFEEHLADCSNCMDEVWRATQFGANAREVFREHTNERPVGRLARWFQWRPFPALAFSAALNVALAGVVAYGALGAFPAKRAKLARLSAPGPIAVVEVRGVVRDASGAQQVVKAAGDLTVFSFDLPQRYERYVYSVADASGRVVMSGDAGSDSDSATKLNLKLPVGGLAPGEYKVTAAGLAGNAREELGTSLIRVGPN
jgi:hypothetical protein